MPELGKKIPLETQGGVDNLQFQSIFKSHFENFISFWNDISARDIIYLSVLSDSWYQSSNII